MVRTTTRALRRTLGGLLVLGTPLWAAGGHGRAVAADEVAPQCVVGALEDTYGVHPGQRRNHTKGTCALGEFVGRPEGAAYSRSALFSGRPVPVVARFSLAGGDPSASDAEKSPRGMALEFRLPDGALQHMTMLNTPMFFAAVPRTFLDRLIAGKVDPATGRPDSEMLKLFASKHPESLRQAKFLADHNPPRSYADSAYFGIHTFKFVAAGDKTTLVRWRCTSWRSSSAAGCSCDATGWPASRPTSSSGGSMRGTRRWWSSTPARRSTWACPPSPSAARCGSRPRRSSAGITRCRATGRSCCIARDRTRRPAPGWR